MNIQIVRFLTIAIHIIAAAVLSIMLTNRGFIVSPVYRFRPVVTALTGIIFMFVGYYWSRSINSYWWNIFPVIILLSAFCIEIKRKSQNIKYTASSPYRILHLRKPSLLFTTTDLRCLFYSVSIENFNGEVRVCHFSDLHANKLIPFSYYESVFSRVKELEPDIVLITGDFVCRHTGVDVLEKIAENMQFSRAYAILGNHDHWIGEDKVTSILNKAGIRVLKNEYEMMNLKGNKVFIAGTDFPWGGVKPNFNLHNDSNLAILAIHSPDAYFMLDVKYRFNIVFAGHCHGGHIRIPFFGSIITASRYGRIFDRGHFCIDNTHLFVTSGIGSGFPPFRILCPPDITIVDINKERRI